ncbi:EXLDI protein [Actinosynnema sp. NPDC047251]|uniref:EXLDI protein n=1 Tax=Saccharothrix espanaensis (strain ATCC 51144 / DSM 44229 / JCM 9112 / NBRC 15066 / NRRL 15764) TaxID=1179773 RepID=K0JXP3_SACES|nr:EXLDI protein [Saccharothrix espanaensis]CCH32670.1 hypothetical protein BN6_54110 [Saccharothrix espanaensis DSM 44229]
MEDYREVDVGVGHTSDYQRKRFIARRIGEWYAPSADARSGTYHVAYETQKGRYALHTQRFENWPEQVPAQVPEDNAWWTDATAPEGDAFWNASAEAWGSAQLELHVFERFEELLGAVPRQLAANLERARQSTTVEELDI